jgi:hypothetical protein
MVVIGTVGGRSSKLVGRCDVRVVVKWPAE